MNLEKYKREKAGFKVPENYFESSSARLKQIPYTSTTAPVVISIMKKYYPLLTGMAAVLIVGIFFINRNEKSLDFTDISDEQIETYLHNEYEYGIQEPLILTNIEPGGFSGDTLMENVSDKEINDLLEDKIDETLLFQLL